MFSGKVKFEANAETKIFENLHTIMGIVALFERFVTQNLFFRL